MFFRQEFWRSKINLFLVVIGVLANGILWGMSFYETSQGSIPFFNPMAKSILPHAAFFQEIFILPLISLFLLIINFILAYKFYEKERIISYLLLGVGFFVQIISFITILVYILV